MNRFSVGDSCWIYYGSHGLIECSVVGEPQSFKAETTFGKQDILHYPIVAVKSNTNTAEWHPDTNLYSKGEIEKINLQK